MGKATRLKAERQIHLRSQVPQVTYEPDVAIDWPHGHVAVEVTDDEIDECIAVTIHGVTHFLHSTTARELSNMLIVKIDEWNGTARSHGLPGV